MSKPVEKMIEAIFIGTSAGGVQTLNALFDLLPDDFKIPMVVVIHLGEKPFIPTAFRAPKGVKIVEAEEKDSIQPGFIYFAPANYHLLVEEDKTFSLTNEDKVQYARPALDVTMDSMAQVYNKRLVGIVLTGANEDGARGLKEIKEYGGLTIAQDPKNALYATMPEAAINMAHPEHILTLEQIGSLICNLKGAYE